jgi:hypothetical protein
LLVPCLHHWIFQVGAALDQWNQVIQDNRCWHGETQFADAGDRIIAPFEQATDENNIRQKLLKSLANQLGSASAPIVFLLT